MTHEPLDSSSQVFDNGKLGIIYNKNRLSKPKII